MEAIGLLLWPLFNHLIKKLVYSFTVKQITITFFFIVMVACKVRAVNLIG